jgi:hypothetical protein
MAFTAYHNIVGGTTREVELIGVNDLSLKTTIKSIHLNNIHTSSAAAIDLYLYKGSTDSASDETYYILREYALAAKTYLILDNLYILNFDNTKYSLFISVGGSDTVDVLIGK